MASPNTFDVPDPKQTLKKLPYEETGRQHCNWTRIEMPASVTYVRECHCHDCNQTTGSQRMATLKTILLTSLILLIIVLISNSARMSSCRDSHVSQREPGFKDEMMVDVVGPRLERDVKPGINLPQTSKQRKHRRRKGKDRKKKERSRRSNSGMRARVQEIQRTLGDYRRQIAALNRSITLNSVQSERIAIHLTYTLASHDSLMNENGYFIWTLMPSSPGYDFFHYNRAPNQAYNTDIYRVEIVYEGQYLVYSQIIVNGKSNPYLPYECGHETVLVRNSRERKLLGSYITQDNGGSTIGDPALRPKDTNFQMGVFHLRHGDEIGVRIPAIYLSNCLYHGDEESYFGLIRL